MIQVPDRVVKELLEAMDDVFFAYSNGEVDMETALWRLREAKHQLEETAREMPDPKG